METEFVRLGVEFIASRNSQRVPLSVCYLFNYKTNKISVIWFVNEFTCGCSWSHLVDGSACLAASPTCPRSSIGHRLLRLSRKATDFTVSIIQYLTEKSILQFPTGQNSESLRLSSENSAVGNEKTTTGISSGLFIWQTQARRHPSFCAAVNF